MAKTATFQTLREALQSAYTVDTLKRIGRSAGLKELNMRKEELVALLLKTANSSSVLDLCSALQRKALAEAAHDVLGGFDEEKFIARYGDSPYQPSDRYNNVTSLLNLFIVDFAMPGDIRDRLAAILPPPPQDQVQCLDQLPQSVPLEEQDYKGVHSLAVSPLQRDTAAAALRNLETALRLVEAGRIRVSAQTRLPGEASANLVAENLCDGDWFTGGKYGAIQGFAWPLILQAAGFAGMSGALLTPTPKGRKILNKDTPLHRALKQAWDAWQSNKLFDEFNRISAIKGQRSKGRVMTSPEGRRDVITGVLSHCPQGKWISIDEFCRHLRATGESFEVAHDLWNLYFCEREYGSLGYEGFGTWEIVQKRYILVLLMEYAATLGLIDIGYIKPEEAPHVLQGVWGTDDLEYLSRYDGLLYFRINDLGAYALGMTNEFIPQKQEIKAAFVVLPNLDIVVTDAPSLSPADRLYLEKISDQSSPCNYTLTIRSIRKALEQGETCDAMLEFLAAGSQQELPQTLPPLLREAQSRVIQMRFLGRACLLETDNRFFFHQVAADPHLSEMCLTSGEKFIAIMPGKEKQFFGRLSKLGYAAPVMKEIV